MLAWFVGPKTISRPESFITEVAGDDNSFEMVCFNVISYVSDIALFSTHFANISKLMSIGTAVLKSPELFPGMANVPFSPRLWIFLLGACLWTTVFGIFAGETETFQFFHLFQTLQLEFFSNSQYERNQTLLENICFPMIKVHNVQEIFRLQPSFYKLVGEDACSFRAHSGKETGSSQDHLVCFHLLTILTGQSHISKVVVFSIASNALLMFSWKLFHWRHSSSDMPMLQSLRVYMNSSKRAKYRARAKITGQK